MIPDRPPASNPLPATPESACLTTKTADKGRVGSKRAADRLHCDVVALGSGAAQRPRSGQRRIATAGLLPPPWSAPLRHVAGPGIWFGALVQRSGKLSAVSPGRAGHPWSLHITRRGIGRHIAYSGAGYRGCSNRHSVSRTHRRRPRASRPPLNSPHFPF
jgi:hypothetical protein